MPPARFRITSSVLARYFKHRCDRLFRWDTVRGPDRGKAGIGWGVPARTRKHSRPGIQRLKESGDRFEVDQLEALIDTWGEAEVLHAGIEDSDVVPLSMPAFLEVVRAPTRPRFVAQMELDLSLHPDWAAGFLQRFGLDPAAIELGTARPDLIEIIPSSQGPDQLRVWDFKASQQARHEHFIQVAYYAMLLDHILRQAGIDTLDVDLEDAVIFSYEGREDFALKPYRLAVDDFLRNRVPTLFNVSAVDAHFHVEEGCMMCDYMTTCKDEADAGRDLSRVAYMTSTSKRKLNQWGIQTHRELAQLTDPDRIAHLKTRSHNLSVHLHRYIATAQALEDGQTRNLDTTTLLMPRYEDIRVVLSAEQDAVTGTCFALGLKTLEGWDAGKPLGAEHVFLSPAPTREAEMLLAFLQTLNALLTRIDAANRAVEIGPVHQDPTVQAAEAALEAADAALATFKAAHSYIHKLDPNAQTLRTQRDTLQAAAKAAKKAVKTAKKEVWWTRQKAQQRLHFYVYDTIDLLVLKKLMERHLLTEETPGLQEQIKTLVRLFPPESLLPDAESFRSVPGTVVTQVLRTTVALPAPYLYDLRTVSERYQPLDADGAERGFVFRPRYGFGWEHSNQVAFERIHDVWEGNTFRPQGQQSGRAFPPDAIRAELERTVRNKLRATDGVVRRIKQDLQDRLLLYKEPFKLYKAFDPFDFRALEALRVFSMMETALQELGVKHLHTLPAADRSAKFECIRGLQFAAEDAEGNLWFTFDPASRDVKFGVGDFNLVLTPEDRPDTLLGGVDGKLFNISRWRHAPYQVSLEAYNLQLNPPRVLLRPHNRSQFDRKIDRTEMLVLDKVFVDYNSDKILATLARLPGPDARHIQDLVAGGTVHNWTPVVADAAPAEAALRQRMARTGALEGPTLNPGQWRAWRGVFQEPLTMIWGPPGTGKTYTLGHILLGHALAAQASGKSVCILVTAFTHHAIVNVLKKVATLADQYGIDRKVLQVFKAQGRTPHAADADLPERVNTLRDEELHHILDMGWPCLIVGATVWATHKALKKSGDVCRPWFDVVLVDEASQLKLPEALMAFSASKPDANLILAGDDQQLPPIIHGTYPEQHTALLTSVFAFMRHRMDEQATPEQAARRLFQLETNFRMNEPLTAYPREMLYDGRFFSDQPDLRMTLDRPPATGSAALDCMLHPDQPVVLCRYTPPQGFTSRNPIEAELVTALAQALAGILIDDDTGAVFTPQRFAEKGLAVLSPHRAQNSTIRNTLEANGFGTPTQPMPIIDTVDKLQGQERDVVLVSYGVADEEYAEAEAAFLLSRNRFNVAATRARQKLIVFCSDAVLDVVPTDRQVLLDALMLKEFRRYCTDGSQTCVWPSAAYGDVTLHIQWKGFDA